MTFDEYQKAAACTAIYPDRGNNLSYPALGLAGESGEVCNKIKKVFRDDMGSVSFATQLKLRDELGDVLWYISALCDELGIALDWVASSNLEKLSKRKTDGAITGSGDNR